MAQTDLELIQDNAQALVNVFNSPNPPGCKGVSADHCSARRALIELGWIPPTDYGKKNISDRSVPAIKRLQAAIGETVDGMWGPRTSGALLRVLEQALGQSLVVAIPVVTKPGVPSPPNDDSAPPPPDMVAKGRNVFAGIPWIVPVGLLAAAAAGWFFYRRGKANGLSGCGCASMGGHDHDHDHEDHEDPELGEMVKNLRQIPQFRPAGTAGTAGRRAPTRVAR